MKRRNNQQTLRLGLAVVAAVALAMGASMTADERPTAKTVDGKDARTATNASTAAESKSAPATNRPTTAAIPRENEIRPLVNEPLAAGNEEYVNTLYERAAVVALSTSREWLALLHYSKSTMGTLASEVDEPVFFIAPNGKQNPEAEFRATLRALFMVASPKQNDNLHALCRFPARREMLIRTLQIDTGRLPKKNCTVLDFYLNAIRADTVSVVFASYYPGAPPSMFGHTLLKLNSSRFGEGQDLLNYAINYSAYPGETGTLAYIIKGLTGGFQGFFDVMPYHAKVREYSDMENRDMWEYRLNLKPSEIQTIRLHTFELIGRSSFDYYFITENCSYHLLGLIEVARPQLSMSDQFPGWVLPAETIKILQTNGLVTSVHYRPSLYATIQQEYEGLSPANRELYQSLLDPEKSVAEVIAGANQQALAGAADLALQTLRYWKDGRIRLGAEWDARTRELLLARSSLPMADDKQKQTREMSAPPHVGHSIARVQTGLGVLNGAGYLELALRPGFHDLLNSDAGFAPRSEYVFMDAALRYFPDDQELSIEKLTVVRLLSLEPYTYVARSKSFLFDVSWIRQPLAKQESFLEETTRRFSQLSRGEDQTADIRPLVFSTDAEVGLTSNSVIPHKIGLLTFSALGGGVFQAGPDVARVGPRVTLLSASAIGRWHGLFGASYSFFSGTFSGSEVRVFGGGSFSFATEHEARVQLSLAGNEQDLLVGYHYSF